LIFYATIPEIECDDDANCAPGPPTVTEAQSIDHSLFGPPCPTVEVEDTPGKICKIYIIHLEFGNNGIIA
jgi:hypothetical protein